MNLIAGSLAALIPFPRQRTLRCSTQTLPTTHRATPISTLMALGFPAVGYGYGWRPFGAGLGWSPFTMGQWLWDPGFGWTFASYQPWGWAPYHYGGWLFDASCGGWFYSPPAYYGYGGYGYGGNRRKAFPERCAIRRPSCLLIGPRRLFSFAKTANSASCP